MFLAWHPLTDCVTVVVSVVADVEPDALIVWVREFEPNAGLPESWLPEQS